MSEDFFLSKIFGDSLGPSKVIPYYYKAKGDFDKEEITITTLITSNRFKVFSDLVERYQGPISVCIHSPPSPAILEPILDALHTLYESSQTFATYVDVHLVIDPFERQFNMWRNVAKFFARTDYSMLLDVDFWPDPTFNSRIVLDLEGEAKRMMRDGTMALVIPAFEFNKQEDGLDHDTFPTDKSELLELVKAKKIDMFHKSWAPGHGTTNYTRYYESNEIYRAQGYTHSYEPYAIYRKDTPWFDERFIGYGGNKAAGLFELYLSGVQFYVHSHHFLIHQSHPYQERTRAAERRYNRKLYINYREELCFRYLTHLIDVIQTPRARNLLTECKKISGFQTIAQRYISAVHQR
ncbi:glycosyltransferase family 49 protein [Atractiella rhizophila]|nr:glycosyltransferase family 49 protein [Atractiella rhizophila]